MMFTPTAARDQLERTQRVDATEIGCSTAGHDAFFDGCLGRVGGRPRTGLSFPHFGLGRGAELMDATPPTSSQGAPGASAAHL